MTQNEIDIHKLMERNTQQTRALDYIRSCLKDAHDALNPKFITSHPAVALERIEVCLDHIENLK